MAMQGEPTLKELFDLTGKVALVTGGVGWLGSSMSTALAEQGASVIVTSRSADRAEASAKELPSPSGAKHYGIALDHLEEQTAFAGFEACVAAAGQIDILVNNACSLLAKDLTVVTHDEFTSQLLNITGAFTLSRLLRNHVVERGVPGNVIMISSIYGVVASYPQVYEGFYANPVSYQMVKASLVQMTRHLATYWAKDRVRVNCLTPGTFPNPKIPKSVVDGINSLCPLGRIGRPDELKGAVAYLASEASSYMTGHNLVVDGGWTAV